LADFLGTYGTGVPQDLWAHHLETVRSLLSAWWEHPAEEINPPLFLNGKEIIEIFSIEQGPLIGKVLKRLHEAQAVGEVTSRDEAMRFVESYLAWTQKPDGE
jgi:poly(A) polymerase